MDRQERKQPEETRVMVTGGRSGRVWPLVLEAVRAARSAGKRIILYVPEQMTLQTERDLIEGLRLPGLLDLDVISPRKLRRQVQERAGGSGRRPLDADGRVMALHQVMTERGGELRFYRNLTGMRGAVARLDEAMSALRESGLTREEVDAYGQRAVSGAERAKFHDISLIWEGYEQLVSERFEDDFAAWSETVARLERSGMWSGADILVYGFDAVRPDLRELLLRAAPTARRIDVFLTMDTDRSWNQRVFGEQRDSVQRFLARLNELGIPAGVTYAPAEGGIRTEALDWLEKTLFSEEPHPFTGETGEDLTLYEAPTPYAEAENLTDTLIRWHREGIAWERMAVALPAGRKKDSMLRAMLRRKGIPFVCDSREPAAQHGVCRLLLGALRCARDGMNTEDLLLMAGSGFSVLTAEETAQLETYAAAQGIDGTKWSRPFVYGADAAENERLRRKLTEPVDRLREELRNARNAAASVEAVVRFLEAERVWPRLREREADLLEREMYREAVVDRQVWQMLMEMLDQLWTLLGQRRAAMRDLADLMENALCRASISAPPEEETGVTVGEAGHLPEGKADALIFAGAVEGILAPGDHGWLTDPEQERLEKDAGRPVGLSREREARMRRYDVYRTLSLPLRRLRISWSLREDDGSVSRPDGLTDTLKSIFPGLRTEGGLEDRPAGEITTPQTALNCLAEGLADMRDGLREDLPDRWKQALAELIREPRYGETMRRMLAAVTEEDGSRPGIRPETAERLFLTDRLSISRLERYAACPYRHFIDYGIHPTEQESFEFADSDAGDFFHAVLDRFLKKAAQSGTWPDWSEAQVEAEAEAICAEEAAAWEGGPLREDILGIWQGEDYRRRVCRAAGVLTRFAANSDFRVLATEQPFGEPDGWPPLMLTLRDGSKVAIRGKIDRIDTYRNGEGIWLRIMDYKSREKRPDAAKMAAGSQLQLMIYLKAALQAVPEARAAGAFYFPVSDREVETETDSPDEIEEERLKRNRMKGLVAADPDVVSAVDRGISPYSMDAVFTREGAVRKSAPWAVEESVLRDIMDRETETAAELAEGIRSGIIDASPETEGELAVCRYCGYQDICHRRPKDSRPLDPAITFRDVAAGRQKKPLQEQEK